MTNIAGMLAAHARRRPDSPFCTFLQRGQSVVITFRDLFDRSAAYAQKYRELHIGQGDLVLIILQHTPHLFYSYLGAMLAGAVPSFMPFPSPKQRPELYWQDHAALFKRIQPNLIVTYEDNLRFAREALPDYRIPTLIAGDSLLSAPAPESLPGLDSEPDAVACLQHSSGTTGLKKGVMLTHRAIAKEVHTYARAIDFTEDDSIASWLPLYHDMGFIGCFMTSVVLGTHLVALDPFEWVMRPTLLLDALQTYRTTFTWLPNFAFSHIVNTARRGASWNLAMVRAFINCSEPCKAATFERFYERFSECGVTRESLQVCYAMAENVFAVTQTALDQPVNVRRGYLSCGTPVSGVTVEIRDENGSTLPEDVIGEVCLQSPFLFDGYYKLPEKTHEKMRGGWYHSGDMGFMFGGELYVTGRMDDMLIVNGRNYYAHEIEAIVNEVPGVLPGRNVAVGVNDPRTDATTVVVLAECAPHIDETVIASDIKRSVLETLGLALHAVVVLDRGEMVKTTSGKISRSKNKELYENGSLTSRGGVRVG